MSGQTTTLLLEQAYKLIDLLIENHPNDAKTFTMQEITITEMLI